MDSCHTGRADPFNLGFERLGKNGEPAGWKLPVHAGYSYGIDSLVRDEGKYALRISGDSASNGLGVCVRAIPPPVSGDTLMLSGYIKSENVTGAGLWLRIDGSGGMQALAKQPRAIQGTHDWKKYTVRLPYDAGKVKRIALGAMLVGKGRIWVDNLRLTVDGKPISRVPLKKLLSQGLEDPAARRASVFLKGKLSPEKIKVLANLGMLWGFLKYYHPAVTAGKYNWDQELFRVLPSVMQASGPAAAYRIMEEWTDGLGDVPACHPCNVIPKKDIKIPADFGQLFEKGNLPASLVKKIAWIRDHYSQPKNDYYVSVVMAGNIVFTHEIAYEDTPYPDAALRLLSLFRYWNMIQYFYPDRYLIKKDWDKVLAADIPMFVDAPNKYAYVSACLKLIATIGDTHANIWGYNPTLDSLKGVRMAPFTAQFAGDNLVVTGYYQKASPAIRAEIAIGDIVEEINGITTDSLVRKFLPLTPASNYRRQLWQLASARGFLLRTNQAEMRVRVSSRHHTQEVALKTILVKGATEQPRRHDSLHRKGYQMLDKSIGYLYPAGLKAADLDAVKVSFSHAKGIIIDLRSDPSSSSFMPFTYGAWLKRNAGPFVRFTHCSLAEPGSTVYGDTVSNGGTLVQGSSHYKGKVIILVSSSTMSHAEYTAMALSTVPGSVVVGSQTAGADGNISPIELPGGIHTMISGLGVYYPDGTGAQQVGVKINVKVSPDIESITKGEDLYLKKAIALIEK